MADVAREMQLDELYAVINKASAHSAFAHGIGITTEDVLRELGAARSRKAVEDDLGYLREIKSIFLVEGRWHA